MQPDLIKTCLTAPLAALYRSVTTLRHWAYDRGHLGVHGVAKPVISIGNLTAGGTGKTPTVDFFARECRDIGLRVGIISRGYRSQMENSVARVDLSLSDAAAKFGDEPTWLAMSLRDIPVYVGRDKVAVARSLIEENEVDLIIADDAFQHRRLRREYDVVLIDATAPEWHYRALPLGRMRDDFAQLKRAQAVVLTKTNFAEPSVVESWRNRLHAFGVRRIFEFENRLRGFSPLNEMRGAGSDLFGKRLLLFSGLARPETFPLLFSPEQIAEHMQFADHQTYSLTDLGDILERARMLNVDAIVTTEKDAVKLRNWRPDRPVFVAQMESRLSPSSLSTLGDLHEDLRRLRV